MSIRFLSPEEVLFIHARLIEETGGVTGLRDIGMLLSAVARPQASFASQDLYPDMHAKAAALLHSLVLNHAFLDGNKRVAFAASQIFLRINGIVIHIENSEVHQFVLACAQGEYTVEDIAEWFRRHSVA